MLDTHELDRRPGTMRRVRLTVPAPADLGIEVVGVPEGADVELQLRLESVMEGVLVSGTARAPLAGECARCLDPIDGNVEADIQEMYVFDGDDADEEERRVEGELIDLEPTLRDAVVLALPQAPLCRDDCPGLCSQCGARLADDPGHAHSLDAPRWGALLGVSFSEGGSPDPSLPADKAGHTGQSEES